MEVTCVFEYNGLSVSGVSFIEYLCVYPMSNRCRVKISLNSTRSDSVRFLSASVSTLFLQANKFRKVSRSFWFSEGRIASNCLNFISSSYISFSTPSGCELLWVSRVGNHS